MPTHDNERNDDLIKARQRQEQQSGPRADGGSEGVNLLSALGNARVQRLMRSALQRQGEGSGEVDDAIANTIQAKRGSGQALDEGARRSLEPALGADFSDVRVHTDSEADGLNHAVQAEAFTTGKDIFFREGRYNPGSTDGQKLLAHELTHVVQQQSSPPSSGLTVSDPQDASEREAGHVAESFSASASAPAAAVSRAEAEEDELAMSRLDRESPEEEEIAMSRLDLAEMDEEELAMSPLAPAEMPEEEELAMSRLDRESPEEEEIPT
ncbi:MAG TPA: DUF4157 domain-containing protein [Dehalococcoidia bacterium]|jgi:hypothetical protein|nr:DUF4157 domain-containing protein [Dehalococcoidia bacterium]